MINNEKPIVATMLMNGTVAAGNRHAEFRVAILENNILHNLFIDRPEFEEKKGNIYKGIITRVEPSLEAYFVDYGVEKQGFLPFKEISSVYLKSLFGQEEVPSCDRLQEGMEIMVQVDKEERGNKGAALTNKISLAARYLVITPTSDKEGISRRIDGEDREELKQILASLDRPADMGIIIRTAGLGKNIEALQWDFKNLQNHWEAIQKAYHNGYPPFLIYRESDIVVRAIRDYLREDIAEIFIDSHEVFVKVQQYIQQVRPDFSQRVKLYQSPIPLFSRFGVETQIATAFQHEVRLPSGGVIVIDHTEALVSIDINSSRATRGGDIEETALTTNLEAAKEIARQLRLRDIGGLVVIDFIDMEQPQNRRQVEECLTKELANDRARVQIGRISRFGLLEMSRQRLRPSLGEASQSTCPRCLGHGSIRSVPSIALSILRLVEEAAIKSGTTEVRLQTPIDISTFLLNEKRETVQQVEQRHQVKIMIIPNNQLESPHYKIEILTLENKEEQPEASYKIPHQKENGVPENNKNKRKNEEPMVKQLVIGEPHPITNSTTRPSILKRLLGKLFTSKTIHEETPEIFTQPTAPVARHKHRSRRPKSLQQRREDNHRVGQNNQPSVEDNVSKTSEDNARSPNNKRRRHPLRHNRQYNRNHGNHPPRTDNHRTHNHNNNQNHKEKLPADDH